MNVNTNEKPMTDLQEKVLSALNNSTNDKERVNAVLHAVSVWYLMNGYFGRSYEIDAQIED